MVNQNKVIEEIDREEFRKLSLEEISDSNKHLSNWLEGWVEKNRAHLGTRKPWAPKGREFVDFSETLYHVLYWYAQFKSGRFRDMGWEIEKEVIKNIEGKFCELIKYALIQEDNKSILEYLKNYDLKPLSLYTAIDYKFQNITGVKISSVLDFGAGIGRQAFQWCSREDVNFFSVDAIESLYLLQNKVYSLLFPEQLREYFYDSERFRKQDFYSDKNRLFHLPTWRMDLLPDKYFDMIICVQVLQEINEKTLRFMLKQFKRIIRNNGFLYIRDNEFWQPTHRVRVGRELLKQGWELIFRYSGREGYDIEGIPRLWVFTGKDNSKYFRHKTRIKKTFFPSHPFSFRAWKDYGLPI